MFDWGVEGGEHVTGVYAATAAPSADSFGLIALRQGRIARAFVAVGTVSVVLLYTAPFARALLSHPPARVHTLNSVVAPTLQFPSLKIPAALKAKPVMMAAPIVTPAAAHVRARRVVKVPIVTAQVDFSRAKAKLATTVAPPPAPPTVVSSVGVEPAGFGVGAASTDLPAPVAPVTDAAVPDSPAPAVTPATYRTTCSCAPVNSRMLAKSTIANSSPPPAQITVSAPPLPPTDPPAVTTTDATAPTDPGPTTISAPPALPSSAPATTTTGSGPDATPATTSDSVTGSTAPSTSGSSAGPSPATTPETVPAPTDPSLTVEPGDGAVSDPAVGAGGARAPPSSWVVTTADSSAQISIAVSGADLVITVNGVTESRPLASVSGVTISGAQSGNVSVDLGGGAISVPVVVSGATSLSVGAGVGSDYSYDGTGVSVTGGGIASISLPSVTAISAGGAADTLHGPAANTTWTITGANSGVVDGLAFAGFENLKGAAGNRDTFDVVAGGSVSGTIDGGPGGFDTLQVTGDTLVSNPKDAHSGAIVVNGAATITYAGLEPLALLSASVTINGTDLGGSTELLDKDYLKVSPYSDAVSSTAACQTAGNCIQVENYAGPFGIGPAIAELSYFVIAGTTDVTINGGLGTDTVEFTGNYLVPNSKLTVNAEHIKVDSGLTIDVGSAAGNDITFNAVYKDNGISILGITTTIPILGVDPLVDIDGATINGNTINLTAFAGTLSTTVSGGSQDLSAGNLVVASVAGFDNSAGTFTVVGGTGTCAYTGRDTGTNKLTGITGCTGIPLDAAVVTSAINETGSGKGVNHAAEELEYSATVNIHGGTSITASGNVTLASNVDVTATANATPIKGTWSASTAYLKNDVVIDSTDGKRYSATSNVGPSATPPSSDSGQLGRREQPRLGDRSVDAHRRRDQQPLGHEHDHGDDRQRHDLLEPEVERDDRGGRDPERFRRRDRGRRGRDELQGLHRQHGDDAGARAEPHRLGRHEQHDADEGHGQPGRLEGQRHLRQQPDAERRAVECRGRQGGRSVEDRRRQPEPQRRPRRHRADRDDRGVHLAGGRVGRPHDRRRHRDADDPRGRDKHRLGDRRRRQRQVLARRSDPRHGDEWRHPW